VLLSVHRLLLEMTQADMFVTAFYAVLEPGTGNLRYARAGHDSPLHVRPSTGVCQLLEAKGMLLGCLEDVQLEEATIQLQPGDVLLLYTDGITDANSPSGEFFGTERLRQAVCAALTASAQDLCNSIFARVSQFQAGAVQYDDMALLTVKRDPA
jgi:sigma-B regulation protein RsbU (phosphoserine phosphatase)